jgi:predicted amidohydrolase
MEPGQTIRVAAIQCAPAFLDLSASLALLEKWAKRAADSRAQIIAFPESWLPGYPAWLDASPDSGIWDHPGTKTVFARLFENSVEIPGPATEVIQKVARDIGSTLVVGVNERIGRSLYNSLLTVGGNGEILNIHRKLVPTYTERLVWGRGEGKGLRVVETGGIKLGGLICWEHWMPMARQVLHDQGEQIHVASWPWVKDIHQVAVRHYAFEGRCFVIASGGILRVRDLPEELPAAPELSHEADGYLLRGGTAIVAPDGRYLTDPVYEEETVVTADCDLSEIVRESMTLDVSGHYSRRDLFQLNFAPGELG